MHDTRASRLGREARFVKYLTLPSGRGAEGPSGRLPAPYSVLAGVRLIVKGPVPCSWMTVAASAPPKCDERGEM